MRAAEGLLECSPGECRVGRGQREQAPHFLRSPLHDGQGLGEARFMGHKRWQKERGCPRRSSRKSQPHHHAQRESHFPKTGLQRNDRDSSRSYLKA